jgi:serine kinase of HPr protein (carbohydrate metabolism regulator)
MSIAHQATCVAISGRGVLIEGAPGTGKSSLALALIDRGAVLVGDDGVLLLARDGMLIAAPHPEIGGKLEVRNVGLIDMPVLPAVPVALVIRLEASAPRFIDAPEARQLAGISVPLVHLFPDTPALALRTEIALATYGLTFS